MEPIIQIRLFKTIGENVIFNGPDIIIKPGEFYLVIGRNGIGKSTLLKMLASYPYKSIPDFKVSYMPSDLVYYRTMRIHDLFKFYADTDRKFNLEFAFDALSRFGLIRNKKIDILSSGEKRILAFIICLSRDAQLYIIDEPFPNVDLINNELFRKIIIEKYDDTKAFVVATHQINEFEKMASRCILIQGPNHVETYDIDSFREKTNLSVEEYFKESIR